MPRTTTTKQSKLSKYKPIKPEDDPYNINSTGFSDGNPSQDADNTLPNPSKQRKTASKSKTSKITNIFERVHQDILSPKGKTGLLLSPIGGDIPSSSDDLINPPVVSKQSKQTSPSNQKQQSKPNKKSEYSTSPAFPKHLSAPSDVSANTSLTPQMKSPSKWPMSVQQHPQQDDYNDNADMNYNDVTEDARGGGLQVKSSSLDDTGVDIDIRTNKSVKRTKSGMQTQITYSDDIGGGSGGVDDIGGGSGGGDSSIKPSDIDVLITDQDHLQRKRKQQQQQQQQQQIVGQHDVYGINEASSPTHTDKSSPTHTGKSPRKHIVAHAPVIRVSKEGLDNYEVARKFYETIDTMNLDDAFEVRTDQ